jgi:uncharacterized DUF497 family protein
VASKIVFDWDEGNTRHLARHAVSSAETEQCYRNDPLIVEEQFVSGELRFLALGETDAARRLAFVFTVRRNRGRVITAYAMTPAQRAIYDEG